MSEIVTERQFKILRMWCVDRLSQQEIAAALGVSQQTVSADKGAALKKLVRHDEIDVDFEDGSTKN